MIPANIGNGTQRTFSGAALQQVAFPLGGIGTGTVALGGRGDLRDWEIFNRPAFGTRLPFTFFALWTRPSGAQPSARVLERRLLPPFVAGAGLRSGEMAGLPRLAEARFTGAYPFAHIAFDDPAVPLNVELLAFNPFIPLNADDSGLPSAIFRWRLHNPLDVAVETTLAFSLFNPIGYDGQIDLPRGRRSAIFGGHVNEWVKDEGLAGLRLTRPGIEGPAAGSLAVATTWPRTTFLLHWERAAGWYDDLQSFWDNFSATGRLADDTAATPSPTGQTDVGTLGLMASIPAGGTVELPFILSWCFPNLTNYWNQEQEVTGKRVGNYYATRFSDAWDAARYTAANLPRLEAETRSYHDTLFESTLPPVVLDAASSQSAIIRTTTCLRAEDGRFNAFEGCNDNSGCCPMNCTHVWNYEQTLAHLFPDMERSMRLTDFAANTLPSGEQRFRTLLPLSSGALWSFTPAADGQMGSILKLYREWQMSGDDEFLRQLWPAAKSALEWAWEVWDRDRDGVMEGEQHNTYDVEFYGPNTMMGTLYLAALRAGEEMARVMGDGAAADEYRRVFELGRSKMDADLWNGEFYVQKVRNPLPGESIRNNYTQKLVDPMQPDEDQPRYQYGPGCLSDQMLGQWFAHVLGLGYVLPEGHVRTTMNAIAKYNHQTDLSDHNNCQRTYALNGEGGLLLCSWPNGGRPRYPFPYADEVWTGIEYQVAAHLMYEGMIDQGVAIVESVRGRHDGIARNPWDEFECGHHYARAMASWSLLLALSGYHYSAPARRLAFAPRINEKDFRCFFSTGGAWGSYSQKATGKGITCMVEVRYGRLALRTLELGLPDGRAGDAVTVTGPSGAIAAGTMGEGPVVVVQLAQETSLEAGQQLSIALE
jgi:non-lysosomal glucosylceramidase